MEPYQIAIIGGGPGGLMTAFGLEKRAHFPHEITVFEASNRVGGKIITPQFSSAAVPYEGGAAELYDYSGLGPDPLRELVAELGLSTSAMRGDVVVLDDQVIKTQEDIRRILGEPSAQALRAFAERARLSIRPPEYYEPQWNIENASPLSAMNFHSLLDEIGDEAARRYLEVAVHSDLATEPDQTNGIYGLQNYLMNHPEYMSLYTIDGGLERLPRELANRLRAKIHLRQPVVSVGLGPDGLFTVESRKEGELVEDEFDFVVVAMPNHWLPFIEWEGPVLGRAMREHVAHYRYPAHYLRVSLLYAQPFWQRKLTESYFMTDAFGGSCVYDESARHGSGSHGVLGWLLGGEAALAMSNLSDAQLINEAVAAFPPALQEDVPHFIEGRVHRWLGAVSGLPGGHPQREPESRHVPEPSQHPWLFTVGDYLFDSTLNGVLDSADIVVEKIIDEVAEDVEAGEAGESTP